MIPLTDVSWHTLSWQDLAIGAISEIDDLVHTLNLPPQKHFSNFPLKVPLPFLNRIEKGNPQDPLLLQILSSQPEMSDIPGYSNQPLDEQTYTPHPGLIQKYYGRVLIIVSGACAINCRYCFRRHFPYQSFQPDTAQWLSLLQHIEQDDTITEVILSGGDPLMLPDKRLQWITAQIEQIAHVKILRLHSRLPVAIPQRICPALLDWVTDTRLKVVLVNHINHANEIDDQVVEAMQKLKNHGVTLLNQSVLLKCINDSVKALSDLSENLFEAGILPYYIHLLDPVAGAAHFNVEKSAAIDLLNKVRSRLPGYLVPKLVQELPGTASKQLIA